MKITCVSDMHGKFPTLEAGDLLIVAGDSTASGTVEQLSTFGTWLDNQPFRLKLVIAGNHDWLFQTNPMLAKNLLPGDVTYVEDQVVSIMQGGLNIYGSPWTLEFKQWAFMKKPEEMEAAWAKIPDGIDVLITHQPPHGILDSLHTGEHAGCPYLAAAVRRTQPRLHVFGHVHESYGVHVEGRTTYANVAYLNEHYQPTNSPFIFELD